MTVAVLLYRYLIEFPGGRKQTIDEPIHPIRAVSVLLGRYPDALRIVFLGEAS